MGMELDSLMKHLCLQKTAQISKEELRVKAKENLVRKFGKYFQDEDCRTLKQKSETLEGEDGLPLKINLYFPNTRKYEKEEIEKQRIRDYRREVRPQTGSQDFIDKYFPSEVPIGPKIPVFGYCLEGQRPPVVGYKRDRFQHSSLRDTVGLYHSLLTLDRKSKKMTPFQYEREITKLETLLDRINPNCDMVVPTTNRYKNLLDTIELHTSIEVVLRLKE